MKNKDEFPTIFETLKAILKPFEPRLDVVTDGPKVYSLNTRVADKNGRPVFFGAVKTNK